MKDSNVDERYLFKVSLDEMIEEMVDCLRKGTCYHTYYWYSKDKGYLEIKECDLFHYKIVMENGDFSYFDWEMGEDSNIYREAI